MQNIGYLVAAYLILWLGLFAYLLWLAGSARSLRAELSDLRSALQDRGHVADAEAPAVPTAKLPRR